MKLRPEYELKEGEKISYDISASNQMLFSFNIGSDPKISSISVLLNVETTNTSKIRMFVTKQIDNTTVPSSQNTAPVLQTWLGLVSRIYTGNYHFCRNCSFKVLITSEVDTAFTLRYKTNQGVIKIKGDSLDTYEVVQSSERNCYLYNVTNASESIDVYLNVFSGDPNIFVNPITLPDNTNSFALHSSGKFDEVLTITPEQRKTLHASIGPYYICIHASIPSSYGLTIQAEEIDSTSLFSIYSGLTRTMNVKRRGLRLFEYDVKDEEKTNITVTLTSLAGNADLYIKSCFLRTDEFGESVKKCTMTQEELRDFPGLKSENTESVDSLTFIFNPEECSGENMKCSYLIGVYGESNSHFSLSVLGDPLSEISLVEGEPFFAYVGLKQYTYFTFSVEDEQVSNVKIQLTSLSGDADLYTSRKEGHNPRETLEYSSSHQSYIPDTVTYQRNIDGLLKATYHIAVYGFTASSFSIYYSTRSITHKEISLALYDGQPQQGSINSTALDESYLRYHFSISISPQEHKDIMIMLTPLTGRFDCYVGVDYEPTYTNYTWTMGSSENNIKISRTDSNFIRQGQYNILVQKERIADEIPHLFTIKFSTGSFHTNIVEGLPEFGNMTMNEISYYSYHVVNLTGSITVSVTPISGDPDLYISINSSNRYPSSSQYDYNSVAIGADSIKLNLTEFHNQNPTCSLSLRSNSRCIIFIAVRCTSDECSFTLQVARSDEMLLQLVDGYPQYGNVQAGEPQFYMFRPSVRNDSTIISVSAKTGKVKFYVVMLASGVLERESFPSPTKYDLVSIERVNYQIGQIPAERVTQCGLLCKFFIGVYLDTSDASVGAYNLSEFTIVATSGIRQLIDGQTVVDRVGEKVYQYYRFRVTCTNCILSISLAPLSGGDPDLFVNHALFRLPTSSSADFQATTFKGDFLQITPQDEVIKNNPRGMRGPYIIGVYGSQNCIYSLTVTTSASILQEISQNIPIREEQERSTIKYYTFYSWKKANLKISLSMHSGRATIRANVVSNVQEINVLDKLPSTEQNSMWSSMRINAVNYLMINKDDAKFLETGVYFIAIEAEENCNYDISVQYISEEDFVFVRLAEANRVHIAAGEVKRFAFLISSLENIHIEVTTYYGLVKAGVCTNSTGSPIWDVPDSGNLAIRSMDPKFVLGTYYVTLRGIQDSELIFIIQQNVKMVWLSEGLLYKGTIQRNSFSYFFYSIPKTKLNLQAELRFNAHVTLHDNNVIPKMFIKHIINKKADLPNELNYDFVANWDNDLQQLTAGVKLDSAINETLAIAISGAFKENVAAQSSEISIIVWTTGIVLMYPGYQYMNKFENPNEIHTYELSLKQAARAYIEVVPCMGEIEFFVTQSLASITDRKYDLKTTELNKGRLFGILEKPKGTYYVSIRSLGYHAMGQGNKTGIFYTIKTHVSNQTNITSLENYALENYGNIEAAFDSDNLILTWGKVYIRGKSESIVSPVLYSVYVTEDANTNMHTICGIKIGNAEKIASEISENTFRYKLHERQHDKKLIFNVIANIKPVDESIAYTPMTFKMPKFKQILNFNISILI